MHALLPRPPAYLRSPFTLGTAVYVYCIVPDGTDGDHITKSNLTFTVDGAPLGTFKHTPTAKSMSFLYDQLVFAHTGLDDAAHKLVVSSPPDSAFMLDYVLFTTTAANTSASIASSTASAPSASPVT